MKLITGLMLLTAIHALAEDPSLKPYPDPAGKVKYLERCRILADLDGDGAEDMLLSAGPETFGTMGGPWTVYLKRGGNYTAIGEVWAHPLAIAIEPDQSRIDTNPKTRRFARIWVYLRSGGSSGACGYYRVGSDSVDEMKSIKIYPGDGGTDLGRALYDAAFKKSPIPFVIQQSATGEDGAVSWKEFRRK